MPRVRAFALDASEHADSAAQAEILERIRKLDRHTLELGGMQADVAEATAKRRHEDWIQSLHADPIRVALLRQQRAVLDVADRRRLQRLLRTQGNRLRRKAAFDDGGSTASELRDVEMALAAVSTWLANGPDPKRITQERRKRSAPAERHLNESIGPDATLTAVRHWYVPLVVRRVYAFMRCLRPGLIAQGRAKGLIERAEMDRFVSGRLHVIVADFVRAFYPVWAGELTAAMVGTTLRNMRRRDKA